MTSDNPFENACKQCGGSGFDPDYAEQGLPGIPCHVCNDDRMENFANALNKVLEDYQTKRLTANAVTYAIAYGMNDTHDLIDPTIDGFDEDTLARIKEHIKNLQENKL